jgi:type IV pilus assembly protein PilX
MRAKAMKTVRRPQPRQRGVTLIIMLIMLVVVTLVTLTGLRSTTMNERMAGNSRDRQRALQAAEAAVQSCLQQISDGFPPNAQTPAAATATALWNDPATWTNNAKSTAVPVANAGLSANPRCLVETIGLLGSYRVTGRAVGGSPDTVVMLQATYSNE